MTSYEKLKVYLIFLKDKLFQKKFNRKKFVVHQYVNVLKTILNIQLENSENKNYQGISCFDLMCKLHSERWINHPEGNRKKDELQLFLDSFVKSGECEKKGESGYYYRVTGMAIKTIQEYETEEGKHNDSLVLQKLMGLLTLILTLAALFQAKIIEWPPEWVINLKTVWKCLSCQFYN